MLFPANTVMNLLQDLVMREPCLATKLTTHHHPAPTGTPAQHAPCRYTPHIDWSFSLPGTPFTDMPAPTSTECRTQPDSLLADLQATLSTQALL